MTKKEKEYKIQFVVDYTKVTDWSDITAKMAVAKLEKGYGINKDQFNALIAAIVEDTIDMLFEGCNLVIRKSDGRFVKGIAEEITNTNKDEAKPTEEKKPGFLKRVWQRIKRLFSKK